MLIWSSRQQINSQPFAPLLSVLGAGDSDRRQEFQMANMGIRANRMANGVCE
jgi:hypothetical protein